MNTCAYCNAELNENETLCPACGKAQPARAQNAKPAPAPEEPEAEEPEKDAEETSAEKKITGLKIAALALLALALVAFGTSMATSRYLRQATIPDDTESSAAETAVEETAPEEPTTQPIGTEVGNCYFFGAYTQNGETEALQWLVLDKDEDRILLISKEGLECKKFNDEYGDVTWAECSLRVWLNDTFYTAAFSEEEQSRIQSVTVRADGNPDFGTYAGQSTTDKIFLLSIAEAGAYFSSDAARQCAATPHAKNNGAWTSEAGCCWWLLRSPGGSSDSVAGVSYAGKVDPYGCSVDYPNAAVRPAMWITVRT